MAVNVLLRSAFDSLPCASQSVSITEHWVQGVVFGVLWKRDFSDQANVNVKSFIKLSGFFFFFGENSESFYHVY